MEDAKALLRRQKQRPFKFSRRDEQLNTQELMCIKITTRVVNKHAPAIATNPAPRCSSGDSEVIIVEQCQSSTFK